MFSPTYFRARARDPQTPAEQFCAVNAVVYDNARGRASRRWAFTEPAASTVQRSAHSFTVSGSSLRREGSTLVCELDERGAPMGRRVRGRVCVHLRHGAPRPLALDAAGRHQWWPVGACARAEVELEDPDVRFEGSAYHDCNFGDRPLEADFAGWNWSRSEVGPMADPQTDLTYDVRELDGTSRSLALRVGSFGMREWTPAPPVELPPPRWGMPRTLRPAPGGVIQSVRTLEDAPFYSRTAVQTQHGDQVVHTMHESLSMTQFVKPWVRTLLPFRMRRGWRA